MGITVCFAIKCNYCPRFFSSGTIGINNWSYSKSQFVKDCRKRGWSIGKNTACPECKAEGKPRMKAFDLPF